MWPVSLTWWVCLEFHTAVARKRLSCLCLVWGVCNTGVPQPAGDSCSRHSPAQQGHPALTVLLHCHEPMLSLHPHHSLGLNPDYPNFRITPSYPMAEQALNLTKVFFLGTLKFLEELASNVLFLNNYPANRVGESRLAGLMIHLLVGHPKNQRCRHPGSAAGYFCHLNLIRSHLRT